VPVGGPVTHTLLRMDRLDKRVAAFQKQENTMLHVYTHDI
jgi:hypothetical protein